jgi:hypothetical protein
LKFYKTNDSVNSYRTFKDAIQLRNIIFILTIFPVVLLGQTATFSADTSQFFKEKNRNPEIYNKIMEAEWKINGEILHYGSKPISVKTDNIIDTIYYRQFKNSKWDTLICNINKPKHYIFHFNPCCGGFNISDDTNKYVIGSVNFNIKNTDNKRQFLGTLGEAGIIVSSKFISTLEPACRSAMSPNVYQLTLKEFEICKETADYNEVTCLYMKGNEELNYEFSYITTSLKLDCLYLPLSNEPIRVTYDLKIGKVKIE